MEDKAFLAKPGAGAAGSTPAHNDTTGKQGGAAGEYYHLTSAERTVVQNTSGVNTGDQDLSGKVDKVTGSSLVADTVILALTDEHAQLSALHTDGSPTFLYLKSKLGEVYKTANADSPLTALQCKRTIVSNYGMTDADCAITLPAAEEGLAFLCILPTVRARYFRLTANTGDKIYLSGTAGSNAGYVGVASGYATGTACQMFTFKASDGGFDWFCLPIFGTWVAG
jgi:hypothetical protein